MKKDIQVNFEQLDELSKRLTVYLGSISYLKETAKDFYRVISEQQSEALQSRAVEWNTLVIFRAELLADYVIRDYRMLEKYIREMQAIIAPRDSSKMTRVDSADVYWNLQQVSAHMCTVWDTFSGVPITYQDYDLSIVGDLISGESLATWREKRQREQQCRMENYWKMVNIRNVLFQRIDTYIGKPLFEMYTSSVEPYVELDKVMADEAEAFYEEFSGVADWIREATYIGTDAVKLTVNDALGGLEGLYTLALVCTPEVQELYQTGKLAPEQEQRMDSFYAMLTMTFKDPLGVVELMGQNVFDTYDKEGVAYIISGAISVITEIALTKGVGKVIDKIEDSAEVGKTAKAANLLDEGIEGGLDTLSTPSSKVLRQNLIDAGVEVPDYPNAAHHIVAGSSPKAAEARAILQKYGVDINDAANGTFLPTVKDVAEGAYHPSLHTNAYYDKINKLLSEATCKEDVLDILEFIGDELSSGTFMQ